MINFDVITKDPDIAKKLLIGSLLALTGIGVFALLGWMVEIIKQINQGDEASLPDIENIGEHFVSGLRVSVVGLVWSLPLTLIVVILSVFASLAPALFPRGDDAAIVLALMSFCIVGLTFAFIFPMLVLMIPAMGRFAETDSIREALNVRKAFEVARANLLGFVVAGGLGLLISSFLSSIGMLFCFVGVYPAMVVTYVLQGQLFGKAYLDAKNNLGAQLVEPGELA